jgi:predicted transcriptional regulator
MRSVKGQQHTSIPAEQQPAAGQRPAVPIKKSIEQDYIVCLEVGRRFRSMRRHLKSQYNLTPDEYRIKWDLPPDYPMVASTMRQRDRRSPRIPAWV